MANWLINPGIEIAEGASAVHGITTEFAREHGGDPFTVLSNIAEHLRSWAESGRPVVIYNASFDATLLTEEFLRHNISAPNIFDRVIDPLVLDKALDKWRKGSRKLIDTAKHYGIELSAENAHSADFDSLASVQIAREIGKKYQIEVPVEEVHRMTKVFKKEQSQSFQEYLRKKENDPTIIINDEWPIQSRRDA